MCVPDVLDEDLNRRDGVTIWCAVFQPPNPRHHRVSITLTISVSKQGAEPVQSFASSEAMGILSIRVCVHPGL